MHIAPGGKGFRHPIASHDRLRTRQVSGLETESHMNSEAIAERLQRQIAFLVECDRLKEIFRQTLNSQSRRRENDAEHSWALCLFATTLAEHSNAPVDVLRVLKMLQIHDLVEIDAGDTFAYDAAAMVG
jgi:putative hydrolase of HD superfamily